MKNFKKFMALIVAMAMIVGTMSMSAFAATGELSVNNKLTVSGLDEGDKVDVYQILKWENADATHTGGWVYADGVDHPETDLETLVSNTDGTNTITGAIATDLANHTGIKYVDQAVIGASKTWTKSDVPAGLYMVIVTPATSGTVYNPIFVAANYYGDNEVKDSANSIAVTSDMSYADNAMAKKSTIPLDKKSKATTPETANAANSYTTDVGEEIEFTVTTTIPKFGGSYTNPVFTLIDNLDGLELTSLPVVTDGEGNTLANGTEYDLTGAVGGNSYTIAFKEAYLLDELTNKVGAAGQAITVVYKAKVTDAATAVVNQDKNTVDLVFSNNPNDASSKAILRDKTNHFTFSIDANLLGDSYNGDSSTEAIKVGVDKEGNPIVESKSYANNGGVTHAALEGATFTLLNEDGTPYTNALYPDGVTVQSDAMGRITILGLDVGKYKLQEVSAPAGYIKLQDTVDVEITADISEDIDVTEEAEEDGTTCTVTYKTNRLNKYSVKIGGSTTSYTMVNDQVETSKVERNATSSDKELENTKGVELPSTGGMGTTIFYIIGAILVVGAGIVLVTRRRMSAN